MDISQQQSFNRQRPASNAEFRSRLRYVTLSTLNYQPSTALRRRLHQLDCCSVGIANVNDTLPGIRTRFEGLRFASGLPTGRCNRAQHSVKIIYRERNMHRSDVARPKIDMFSIRWREILEQFNCMTIRLENTERDYSAGD